MPKNIEKKLFSVELPAEEQAHGMELLEQFPGKKNGEKLMNLFQLVESTLARNGLTTSFESHISSIDDSIANISAAVLSIVKAAAEERKLDADELNERIESQAKTIQTLQKENETMTAQVAAAFAAESAAKAAEEQASQLAADKAFYEAAARDKEELNILLRDKLAALQDEVLASEKQLDALRAEIMTLKTENDALTREKEKNTANLDRILDSLNDPPV